MRRALQEELEAAARAGREGAGWAVANEGVHERVSFADTIWGFELAGGAYYRTPLRVTAVGAGSRAAHAGIAPGDVVASINGRDTSTLTLQDAHHIILTSGLQIKLTVCAPDVLESTHIVWQDQWDEEEEQKKKRRSSKNKVTPKPFTGAKTIDAWDRAWARKGSRNIVYRESNCHLVPSRYSALHPDKILAQR